MKTTYLRNLLLAVVCLFAGMTAHAQFQGTYEEYVAKEWGDKGVDFKFTDVAAALSTDTTTLIAAFNSWFAQDSSDPNMFFLKVGDELSDNYTQGSKGGFWVNVDGAPQAWGNDNSALRWYNTIGWDVEYDVFFINIGQYPGQCLGGDVYTPQFVMKYGEKQVTFDLTIKIVERPTFEIPEPETLLEKQLNVVGEKETIVEQFPRGGYDSDPVRVFMADVLTALGIDNKDMVTESLDKLLFATEYNTGDVEAGGGMKKDSLTNNYTAGGIGWWVRPVQNENGEETGECSSAGWGDVDRFFVEQFAYDAENDSLICNLGQYPGSCKDDEQYFTYIYIVYGDKAYRLKYTLKLLTQEQGSGLSTYTKVGEETVTVTQEPRDDYSATAVHPDVDAIAAALGCEVGAIGMVALDDKDNFANSTANNGGFWFSDAGTVVAWGNGALFVEPTTANDYSTLNVGQHPNRNYQPGEESNAYLYFTNGTKYYAYTVALKIIEPQHVDYNFESVETRTFNVQALLDNDYTPNDLITIAPESIEAVLGTATPTLYGLNIDSVAAVKGTYSNAYSCDPKPGFWLNKDGRVSVWGDADARVGISWIDNSTMRFFQHPNRNAIGEAFTTQLFLVNEETSKMITVNITLNFVESITEAEVVGSENIALPVGINETEIKMDLTKPAELLGVSVDELLSPNNYYLRGMTANGVYGSGVSADNGLSFDLDGGYNEYGDIYFTIAKKGNDVVLTIGGNEVEDEFKADAQFCFDVDGKQYVYYAKLLSPKGYEDGIENVTIDSKSHNLYDLSGRQVQSPVRGLYIMNNKKFIVK